VTRYGKGYPRTTVPNDGEWVAIADTSDAEWEALREAVYNPRWITDETFSDGFNRPQYSDDLDLHMQEWDRGL